MPKRKRPADLVQEALEDQDPISFETKVEMSDNPVWTNQLTVFNNITIDQLSQSINQGVFAKIIEDKYDEFISVCHDIIGDDSVLSVSCILVDNELTFDVVRIKK